MAKAIKQVIKVQAPAGKAVPGQALGPVLGAAGINIMEFINQFNERTREMGNTIIPAVITVYEDRTWDFVTKTPPVPELIKKSLGIEKGAGNVKKQKVGKLTNDQIRDIAQTKIQDLNARNLESAEAMVRGTAKSMGVEVE
ncbi:MAG TPA: 50S ribosomal protein L11 [Patescibacteria group bacterium]